MLLEATGAAQRNQYAMGTVMAHKAFGADAEAALAAVCSEVDWIEGLLSRFIPESDISRINRSAGMGRETVQPEALTVLTRAQEFSRRFPGYFDVTIEPLVNLWKKGKVWLAPPADEDIRQALRLVDYRDLDLNPWEMTARLRHFGQGVDLGGIGKGYAADKVREVFKAFGVTSAYSNLGGNVVTLGCKPNGAPWKVGIQHPRDETQILGAVAVNDQTVVTSGDYQRFFSDSQGRRRHHILNPQTGCPAEAGLISVTIVADNSMTADALSTVLFVAGKEKAREILAQFPGAEAVLVDTNVQVSVTAGLRERFEAAPGIVATVME